MWIPYAAFVDFVMEGYEMIENLAVYSDTVRFAGSVRIEILSGSGVQSAPLVFMPGGFYQTVDPLGEGTRFRFAAGSGESAYVYAFAATQERTPDGTGEWYAPALLFPQAGVSALLNYQDSTVALPGEDKDLILDSAPGMEYLFLLYAKQALDIQAVMRRFENASGTPRERLAAAVGKNLLRSGVRYDENDAAFAVETDDSRAVVSLIVAIDHR
jgi:hypothetical protein